MNPSPNIFLLMRVNSEKKSHFRLEVYLKPCSFPCFQLFILSFQKRKMVPNDISKSVSEDNISMRASLSSMFRQYLNGDDRNPLADGNDYKRLMEKSRMNRQSSSGGTPRSSTWPSFPRCEEYDDDIDDDIMSTTSSSSPSTVSEDSCTTTSLAQRQRQRSFPGHQVVILPIPSNQKSRSSILADKFYDYFFACKDRYFNADRNELSKDIFSG